MTEINDITALKEDIQKHGGVIEELEPYCRVTESQILRWDNGDTYYRMEWHGDGYDDDEEYYESWIEIKIACNGSVEYYQKDFSEFQKDIPKLHTNGLY